METPASATDRVRPEQRERPQLLPIVVIDDDPDDVFFITRSLSKAGFPNPVLSFGDGADAVQHFRRARENAPAIPPACVVFCDIKMPRMDGFEVLRWFRGQRELSAVRFVMLSGSDEIVDRELARDLGASDYLVKFPPVERVAALIKAANTSLSAA